MSDNYFVSLKMNDDGINTSCIASMDQHSRVSGGIKVPETHRTFYHNVIPLLTRARLDLKISAIGKTKVDVDVDVDEDEDEEDDNEENDKYSYVFDPDSKIPREFLECLQIWDHCVEEWYEQMQKYTIQSWISDPLTVNDLDEICSKNGKCSAVTNFWNKTVAASGEKEFFCRSNVVSAKNRVMLVKSPDDIIFQMNSERIKYFIDKYKENLQLIKNNGHLFHTDAATELPPLRIVLRKWIPNYPTHMEFRCFINKGMLRAVSQYTYHESLNAGTQQLCKTIEAEILAFFKIIERINPYTSVVMDIVKHNDKWQVVEFNEFGGETKTGSALFGWKRHWPILYNAKKPVFVFCPVIDDIDDSEYDVNANDDTSDADNANSDADDVDEDDAHTVIAATRSATVAVARK